MSAHEGKKERKTASEKKDRDRKKETLWWKCPTVTEIPLCIIKKHWNATNDIWRKTIYNNFLSLMLLFLLLLLLVLLLYSYHNRMEEIVHSALFTEICHGSFFFASSSRFLSEYLDIIWNDHIAKTKSFWNGNPKNLCTHRNPFLWITTLLLFILYAEMVFTFRMKTDFVLEKLWRRQKRIQIQIQSETILKYIFCYKYYNSFAVSKAKKWTHFYRMQKIEKRLWNHLND